MEAEAAYRKAIDLGTFKPYPEGNLAYLLFPQPERFEEAEAIYGEVKSLLSEHGKQLLNAFRAIARDNLGEAKENLIQALEQNHPELFTDNYDDLMRVLRLTKTRGYGERLMTFLQESGLGERHWPLYAAFDAYLHGEAKLRDVNPEVRGAAKRIFDWLNATPAAKEQAPALPAKKGRRRKSL